MVEINLSKYNLPTLCRLCLKNDDFVVDIFNHLDSDSEEPLPNRISDLYQVKPIEFKLTENLPVKLVQTRAKAQIRENRPPATAKNEFHGASFEIEKQDGLPKNICHSCLYLTESFSAFRENIKLCESQLRAHLDAIKMKGQLQGETINPDGNRYEGLNGFNGFVPDENCEITVVDPNQEYESSDDCFSMEDSDNEYPTNKNVNGLIPRPESMQTEAYKPENVAQSLPLNAGDVCEPKNTFLCQYCDMAFTAQMDCDEHESRHDAANPFICNFCPFRTVNRQVLIHHIKESHDNERPYVCALCNKGFCRRSDLKKHTIVHTGVRPFSCPVCSKSFSRNTNLTKHMRIHSGVKPHVCQKCPRSFTTSADLVRHQRTHMEVKPHKCFKCSASFTRKDKLQKHYLSHLRKESELISFNGETKKSPSENMVIPLNPFVGINQQDNTYQNRENNQLAIQVGYQTSVYSKGASSFGNSLLAAQLQKPQAAMQIRHDNPIMPKSNVKVHICNICSRTFTRKREFQRHQALHLDSLYKCKVCGKNFNRKDKLFRHVEIHHAEQYNCNQCNISFSKLEALQMHLKIHELHKSVPNAAGGLPYFGHLPEPPPMALGFYSEIKPEE